jgi:predicted ABC-type exoprotein transport system permease subunit
MRLLLSLVLAICGAYLIFSYGESMNSLSYFDRNHKPIWKVAVACFDLLVAGISLAKFLQK